MHGKKKYGGKGMHIEFHTVNPKKGKAADCIYLTADRMCRNKKSPQYLAKCFVASCCTLRVKQNEAPTTAPTQTAHPNKSNSFDTPCPKIKKINCSLPKNCVVYSESFGFGNFIGYDSVNRLISVKFECAIKRFKYPEAIYNNYLVLPKTAIKQMMFDVVASEKEER